MKKYLFPILFLLVLAIPAVFSRFVALPGPPPPPANAVQLDIVSPHNQDIRNAFAAAFNEWHIAKYNQPVALRFNSVGGTGDISRLLQSSYANAFTNGTLNPDFNAPYDLVWGGGDYFFDKEIKQYLAPANLPDDLLKSAYPQPILSGIHLYDFGGPTPPKWFGVCISSFGIVYNPDVYHRLSLPAPAAWKDLARPELAGWVALANPTTSSSAATAYAMDYLRAMADEEDAYLATHPELKPLSAAQRMKNPAYMMALKRGWKRGMGELTLTAANARYITDSGSQPPNDIANGDAAAGMTIDFYGRANEFAMGKDRFRLVFPKGATAMNPDPIAILAGSKGEKYTLANHFIEFLLTPDAQRLWMLTPGTPHSPERALYRQPIRADVYADRAHWTNPDSNPFEDDSGFYLHPEWQTLFNETRLLWAISWSDTREELRSAYKAILAAPEPKRTTLLAQLADFPLTYDDVAKIQSDFKAQPKGKLDEFKARKRIELGNQFRAFYDKLQQQAQSN